MASFLSPASVVLITGASSGFGEAAARRFVAEGAKVVLCARRGDRLQKLSAELGKNAWPLPLDVTDRPAVEKILSLLPAGFSEVDVLVNNAGGALGLESATEAQLDDWGSMVDLNIKGLLYVTHAILPTMVRRNRGHVINLGSVAGTYPYPGGNVYGATKAFVEQFSLNLRADLLGKRIRVTNIEPGMAETEFSIRRFKGDVQRAQSVYEGLQPLTAQDVAEAIFWCASQPEHVNINRLELMPVMQSFAGFAVKREK